MKTAPHYLLLTDTDQFDDSTRATTTEKPSMAERSNDAGGRWHFVLEPIHHGVRIEADDIEPGVFGERLNLLAVVRGIEALDQPSHVTLVTPSKYVGRGIRRDIRVWKENDWKWNRFGKRVSIKHCDLWQRIDRAMGIHKIDCRIFNVGQRKNDGRRKGLGRSTDSLKRLSLVHQQTNPYEIPFATDASSAGATGAVITATDRRVASARNQRRRIVLTSERMNDKFLALDDIEALESRHQKLFKATKTGWTRVTEIDADSPIDGELPAAFGCSAN